MATGTVKWFNPTMGYGFIQPVGGGKDAFVHISAVERAGLTSLNEGQTVEYEVAENRGKSSAENISKFLDEPRPQQRCPRTGRPVLARLPSFCIGDQPK